MIPESFWLRGSGEPSLLGVDFGDAYDEVADAGHHAYALGDRDGSAGVEQVEGVRTLERQLVGAEGREAQDLSGSVVFFSTSIVFGAGQQRQALGFVEFRCFQRLGTSA